MPHYDASPTLKLFHRDDSFVRGVLGPIGSGKSTAMCWEIFRRATEQEADSQGNRTTKWAVIRNCYDDQTEILTERGGWKLFKDLASDDRVAMLDGDKTVFVKPSYYYSDDYVGEMVEFENEGVDFCVTPNHRMYVSRRNARRKNWGDWEFKDAADLYGKTNARVRKNGGEWEGRDVGMSPEMFEWLGFYMAEGWAGVTSYNGIVRHNCTITQAVRSDYVDGLFESAGLPYTVSQGKGVVRYRLSTTLETKPIIKMLSGLGLALTKRVPHAWKNAPSEHLSRFIKGYLAGDGDHSSSGVVSAGTSSRQLADDLQEMAFRCGMVVNLHYRRRRRENIVINGVPTQQNADITEMTFYTPKKHQTTLRAGGKRIGWKKKIYSGKVYCVEVPTHIVYVRRNGKAMWCSQTFPELRDTTLKTWMQWFGDSRLGRFNQRDMTHYITHEMGDGTRIKLEVLFRALDRPEDVKKLLSLELTGAWLNECREIAKPIFDMIQGRVGRYPEPSRVKVGWHGVIADTNPPDTDHWWYKVFEEECPPGFKLWKQPSGLSDFAENVENLPPDYYPKLMRGKDTEWIKVYVKGEYGFVLDGRPVYPEYNDDIHCAKEILEPVKELPLLLGFDFGLTPACIVGQLMPTGQLRIIDEFVSSGMGIKQFAKFLKPQLAVKYPNHDLRTHVIGSGDPAGVAGSQVDSDYTCFTTLSNEGFDVAPAETNDFLTRREAVASFLNRLDLGKPGFLLSPTCRTLRKGFMGAYNFRRMQVPGREVYREVPDKDDYSHPHDACQYLCMRALLGGLAIKQPEDYAVSYADDDWRM